MEWRREGFFKIVSSFLVVLFFINFLKVSEINIQLKNSILKFSACVTTMTITTTKDQQTDRQIDNYMCVRVRVRVCVCVCTGGELFILTH